MAQKLEKSKPSKIFFFKNEGIVFVRDPHFLQKKIENDQPLAMKRFSSCELKPSYYDPKSRHICYAQLPLDFKPLGVRAQINHSRSDFHIILDYVYIKTTESLEEIEPTSVRTFYLFENEMTYNEADIPYGDQYLTELKDDEYEISLMKYVGTVTLPQMYLASQPYQEQVVHVFARDYGKVNSWFGD